MNAPLDEFLDVAETVARAGGAVLLEYLGRMSDVTTEFKGWSTELVTAADRAAEEVVVRSLLERFPDHAVLAEEGVLTPQGRASGADAEYVWIVDPLDGTTNFVHKVPYFCVAVALARRCPGQPDELVASVVHAPALDQTFTAIRGSFARCNGEPVRVTVTEDLAAALVATGFSYNRSAAWADDNMARLSRVLHASRDIRRLGSAELDLCFTAAGMFDAYWELYLQPYDVAAGALVVREAGGKITDLAGGDDWLYGGQILATNGALHDVMLELVGGVPPQAN